MQFYFLSSSQTPFFPTRDLAQLVTNYWEIVCRICVIFAEIEVFCKRNANGKNFQTVSNLFYVFLSANFIASQSNWIFWANF